MYSNQEFFEPIGPDNNNLDLTKALIKNYHFITKILLQNSLGYYTPKGIHINTQRLSINEDTEGSYYTINLVFYVSHKYLLTTSHFNLIMLIHYDRSECMEKPNSFRINFSLNNSYYQYYSERKGNVSNTIKTYYLNFFEDISEDIWWERLAYSIEQNASKELNLIHKINRIMFLYD